MKITMHNEIQYHILYGDVTGLPIATSVMQIAASDTDMLIGRYDS